MSRRADYLAGLRAVAPIMVGIVPFGLLAGATAVEVGLSLAQAIGFSVFVFAGAAQLAAIGLIGTGAPLAIVILTALIINVRILMYSASIAPEFEDEPLRVRAPLAYVLTDQAYAVSIVRFNEDPDVSRRWFYLGAATSLWVVWQVCTAVGALAGASVPAWLPLEFAVPLSFIAILVPAIRDRPSVVAALVGGGVAVLSAGLPFNLGLVAGAVVGIPAGVIAEGWSR